MRIYPLRAGFHRALGAAGVMVLLLGAAIIYAEAGTLVPVDEAYGRRWRLGSEAGGTIRFHVIANSDDQADQALKLQVRDGLREYLLQQPETPEGVLSFVRAHRRDMERIAAGIVGREGYAYPIRVETGRFTFPPSQAEGVFLPAGEYEAVRVVIGNGQGHNWWCILFPPMCFGVAGNGATLSPPAGVQVRSAVLDWWNARHSFLPHSKP